MSPPRRAREMGSRTIARDSPVPTRPQVSQELIPSRKPLPKLSAPVWRVGRTATLGAPDGSGLSLLRTRISE